MRDYFVQQNKKKSTGSAATATKRDQSLAFLLNTSVLNRPSTSSISMPSAITESVDSEVENFSEVDTQSIVDSEAGSFFGSIRSPDTVSSAKQSKKRARSEVDAEVVLDTFFAHRPAANEFLPSERIDELDQFFLSMAATVRKFPAVSIAKIKMGIAQMVGQEEIVWAEKKDAKEAEKEAQSQQVVQYVVLNEPQSKKSRTSDEVCEQLVQQLLDTNVDVIEE